MDRKPQIGQRVHYVMNDVGLAGQHRAADIVNIGPGSNYERRANLIVLLDGPNDLLTVSKASDPRNLFRYVENVEYSQEVFRNGTWHFIDETP